MTASAAWGIVCGVVLGIGLWSIVAVLPRMSRPRLAERIAPYLVDVSEEARLIAGRATVHPLPVIGSLLGPMIGSVRRGFSHAAGSGSSIAIRLRQAGSKRSVDEFRARQLAWMLVAFAAGIGMAVVVGATRPVPLIVQLMLPLVSSVTAYAVADWLLKRSAMKRLRRIADEFPTVVEFLTLSLSAGEGILDAVRRVSRISSGELAQEFADALADVGTGTPFAHALDELARSIRLPLLSRCIEAVTAALERGTPLAEVLRAQAGDARSEAKRDLLEAAGKKEVAMLVPLVFLILPCTVLFAIFPGVFVLQSGF